MRKLLIWGVATLGLATGLAAVALTQGPPLELKVGDPAPAFSLMGSDGRVHKLSDYKGRAVVLAWFPKAFTGG